jgi:hypothetical protein
MKFSRLAIICTVLTILLSACGNCDPAKEGYSQSWGNAFGTGNYTVSFDGIITHELTVKNITNGEYTHAITINEDGNYSIPIGNENRDIAICNSYLWFKPK